MDDRAPIIVEVERDLIEKDGIDHQYVNFSSLTLESDEFIAVRTVNNEKQELQLIDLKGKSKDMKKLVTAESAIMNPKKMVVALRHDNQIQVYDLENKMTLKSYVMSENIEFWTWITPSIIAIITVSSVYHWNIFEEGVPILYFGRETELSKHKIVGYSVNLDLDWAFISSLGVSKERYIIGALQLYSNEKKTSQVVKAHSATFASIAIDPLSPKVSLLVLSSRDINVGKIKIVGISDLDSPHNTFGKRFAEIPLDVEKKDNFPLFTKFLQKYSMVLVLTKYSALYAYDLATCTLLFSLDYFCMHPCFALAHTSDDRGILVVTRVGKVYNIKLNEQNLIPYILKSKDYGAEISTNIAISANLPGVDEIIINRFNRYIESGEYENAAKLAATAPNSILRTQDTLDKLKSVSVKPPNTPPILSYFRILLENSKLYYNESIELAIPVINRKKTHMLSGWIKDDKLTLSEELADLISHLDQELALEVFKKINCHQKVVGCLISASKFDEIESYCKEKNYVPDYFLILTSVSESNIETAHNISKYIIEKDKPVLVTHVKAVADILLNVNNPEYIQKSISFLLNYVQENRTDYSDIQTKLIKKALEHNRFAAEAIISSKMLKCYDMGEIGSICESKGMYKYAFLMYSNPADMKRCLSNEIIIDDPEVSKKLVELTQSNFFDCLSVIAQGDNPRKDIVLSKILRARDEIDPNTALSFLSQHDLLNCTFLYLNSLIPENLLDANLTTKYIEVACKLSRYQEAADVCKTSSNIDYVRIKDFLKSSGGPCCIPLMRICDRFNIIEELIVYLYQKNEIKMIEDYVENINPSKTPEVVGYLIKLDCSNELLRNLINLGGRKYSVSEIVKVCESGDRLSLIHNYVLKEVEINTNSVEVNTALAKINIEKNLDPEKFLLVNNHYDPKVVGDYCKSVNPNLALICYKKGNLTNEIISLTNECMMFKAQVEYLMELSNITVWKEVISENNPFRSSLIAQLTNIEILESFDQNNVSTLVRAYMNSGNNDELLKILELLVKSPKFKGSKNLQNLFVLTAIKCDRTLLKTRLEEVDYFDAIEIANTVKQKGYFDEAYHIYVKSGLYNEAIDVAIQNLNNMDLAIELAAKVNTKIVWNRIAKGWLELGNVEAAINICIDWNDYSSYPEILKKAKSENNTHNILDFIRRARSVNHEQTLDTEYCLILAKSDNIPELQQLLSSANLVDCKYVAEECYANNMYTAAAMLFAEVPDYLRHAQTLIHLNDLDKAFESANKAKNPDLFLQLAVQCVNNGNFELAEKTGHKLVSKPEKLENLILFYECCGRFEEICSLLEHVIFSGEILNMNICTDLAILYCKYDNAKLVPYMNRFTGKLNTSKLSSACYELKLWEELVSLYVMNNEDDKAVLTIINEASCLWNHAEFKKLVVNVKNYDLLEKVIKCYLEQHVEYLEDLLESIESRLDYSRLVSLFKNLNCLYLILPFLEKNKSINDPSVNTVICDVSIERHDYNALRNLLDSNSNLDKLGIAKKLEDNSDLELRRISSYLYSKNGELSKSVNMSIKDETYRDAILAVAESGNKKAAETLLRSLAQKKIKSWFTFMLFKCNNILDPSIVMELSWLNGLTEYAMPYYIQTAHNLNSKIVALEREIQNNNHQQSDIRKTPMYLPY